MTHPARALAAATVFLLACGPQETRLDVFASYEDGRPISGVEVTAVPHDHAHLLDSLTEAASTPRPVFDSLETMLDAYQLPDVEALHSQDHEWRATRDSVRRLADSLSAVGRDASGYERAYRGLAELYRRFTRLTAEREARLRDQIGADRDLAARAAAAADSIRGWEATAFADYTTLAEAAAQRAGRAEHEAVTGADGIAEFRLEAGPWWITARMRDPDNPFREYYWNIGLVAGRFGPWKVPLSVEFAERRWRH